MSKWRIQTRSNDTDSPPVWVDAAGQVWTGHDAPPPPSSGNVQIFRWTSDGSSLVTLPVLPLDAWVSRNGQILTPDGDYTLSGSDLTFLISLQVGDAMSALLIY